MFKIGGRVFKIGGRVRIKEGYEKYANSSDEVELIKETPKFKVGDRVKLLRKANFPSKTSCFVAGHVGRITETFEGETYVQLDWKRLGHVNIEDISLVEETSKFVPPFYVNCPNEEIWDRVAEKMFEMGGTWNGENVEFVKSIWNSWVEPERRNTALGMGFCNMGYCSPDWYKEHSKNKEINYRDFLGAIELEPDVKIIRREYTLGNSLITSFIKRTMGILIDIPNRLKRALNANLKNFYRIGWINDSLELTPDGKSELIYFLFDKYEKELGEIASANIRKAKKAKREEVDE